MASKVVANLKDLALIVVGCLCVYGVIWGLLWIRYQYCQAFDCLTVF